MNPYKTLEVEENSNEQEIKKAYKKQAAKNHPDKQGGSKEKFEVIKLAYDVLSDPVRREKYDKTGDIDKNKKNKSDVETRLTELFATIIEQEHFKGNIIDNAKGMVNEIISSLSSSVIKTRKKLNKLEKNSGRIKAKDSDNVFEIIIKGKIYQLTEQINNIDSEILLLEKVLDRLIGYEDISPEEIVNSNSWTFQQMRTGTTL